jgi:hypothetical protein
LPEAAGSPTLTAGHQAFSPILSESCNSSDGTEGHWVGRHPGQRSILAWIQWLIVLLFGFLYLPGMKFLNIIFCSPLVIWATSMSLG